MANTRRPSSAFDRTIICLPLFKYSWAVVASTDRSVPWQHEQSSDLFALLEYEPYTDDGSIQLRVIQATRTIETIRVSALAKESRTVADILQQSQGNYTVANLPTYAITSSQRLAIRHASDKQAKRAQFCFHSDTECDDFVKVLKTTALLWSHPTPKPGTVRLQSAPQPLQVTNMGSSSSLTVRSSDHPSSAMGPPLVPVKPMMQVDASRRSTHSDEVQEQATRFVSPQLHRPSACPPSSSSSSSSSVLDQFSNNHYETNRTALPEARHDSRYEYRELPRYADLSSASSTGTPHGECRSSSGMLQQLASKHDTPPPNGWQNVDGHPTDDSIARRPLIAPEGSMLLTLQSLLPPRRELPFGKPSDRSKESRPTTESSRPSSSSSELPALPRPNFADAWSSRGKRNRDTGIAEVAEDPNILEHHARSGQTSQNRPSKVARLSTPAGLTTIRPSHPNDDLYHATPRNASLRADATSIPVHEDKRHWSHTSDPSLPASDTPKFSSPERSADGFRSPTHSRPSTREYHTAVQTSSRPDTVLSARDANQLPTSYQVPRSGSEAVVDELTRYSALAPKEREDWLNNFIYNQLEDENFQQLCVDVEGCWRRKFLDQRRS